MAHIRSLVLMIGLILPSIVVPSSYAQRSPREAEDVAVRLLGDAKSYYNNLEMESMDDALNQIVDLGQRFGYVSPRFAETLAQAYVLKGLLVFINTEDRAETRRLFTQALQTSPSARLSDDVATPTLRQIFQEAQQEAGGRSPAPSYPSSGQGSYPSPQPTYPPAGQQPSYPPAGQQPSYPPAGQQQGYPPAGQQQGYPPAGQQPSYPPAGQQPGYGSSKPSYPPAGQQPTYPPQTSGYTQPSQPSYPPSGQTAYGQQPQRYGAPQPPAQPVTPPQPSGPDISHTPPLQLPSNRPFTIRVRVSSYLRPQVAYAQLFYVSRGTSGNTQRLDLRPAGQQDFEGQLPGAFITGDRLQYYIVLLDQGQNPIANFMDYSSPQVVRIVGGRYSDLSGGLVQEKVQSRFLSAALTAGAGSGTVGEGAKIQGNPQQAGGGFAISGFHLRLAADFWILDSLSVGLNTRLQFDRDPVIAAFLAGALVQWAFAQSADDRWILRGGGGYGEVAHLIPVTQKTGGEGVEQMAQSGQGQTRTFLTQAGPVFYQIGLAYSFQMSDFIALTFGADFLHFIALDSPSLLPDGTFDVCPDTDCDYPSKHFDLSIGVEFTL